MDADNLLLKQFNAGLLKIRELFYHSGRLEDSNTKLDEIVKLLYIEIASVRDPQSNVPSLREILEKYVNNQGLVTALNHALILASRCSIFTNYDGESLLGSNPRFNLTESEEPLARALAEIVVNSFNGYLQENDTAKTFEFLNEAFCHFIRDNFRQNIEDAQYMTPPEAVNYMVNLGVNFLKNKEFSKIKPPIICDPSCGVGSFLAQFYRNWVLVENQKISPILVGQDKVDRMARLSLLNLALFGIMDAKIYRGNSLLKGSPLDYYTGKCDLILTNPPFGARFNYSDLLSHSEEFFPFLHPYIQASRGDIDSELLFLNRYLNLLKPEGLLLAVLPDSLISSTGLSEYLRDKIHQQFVIRSITELPSVTFAQAGTRTKTCIVEIEKKIPKSNLIFMSKVLSLGYEVFHKKGIPYKKTKGKNELELLGKILDLINPAREKFSNLEVISENPSCVAVTQESLLKKGWTPSHYSSDRLSTLETLQSLANTQDFEILPLDNLVTIPPKKRQNLSNNNAKKCISVLHLGTFGMLNIKELLEYKPKTAGQFCQPGDILFAKINPRIPRVLVVPDFPFEVTCSTEFEVMQPKSGYNSYEIMMLLLSEYAQKQIQSLTSGTSSSHNRIKTHELMSIKLIIPKLNSPKRKEYDELIQSFTDANIQLNEANNALQEAWRAMNALSRF